MPKGSGEPGTKAPKGGKGSAILARVTQELRQAVDAEAERTGRSISQVVELWLEQAQSLRALGEASPAIAAVLQEMLRAAESTRRTIGDPTALIEARDALRARWVDIAQNALPNVDAARPGTHAAKAAISAMRFAAIDAYSEVTRADPNDDRLTEIRKQLAAMNAGLTLFPGAPGWAAAKSAFERAAKAEGGSLSESLEVLLATALAAEHAVARAERNPT